MFAWTEAVCDFAKSCVNNRRIKLRVGGFSVSYTSRARRCQLHAPLWRESTGSFCCQWACWVALAKGPAVIRLQGLQPAPVSYSSKRFTLNLHFKLHFFGGGAYVSRSQTKMLRNTEHTEQKQREQWRIHFYLLVF